eukprot:712174-Karenia_brevis.AAC.1
MGAPFPEWPAFPAMDGENWVKASGRLQDFNESLRAFLMGRAIPAWAAYSSHSGKATLLAMACRHKLCRETRQALGYHVGRAKGESVDVYSRDRLVGPVTELSSMLSKIRGQEEREVETISLDSPGLDAEDDADDEKMNDEDEVDDG